MWKNKKKHFTKKVTNATIKEGVYTQRDAPFWLKFLREELELLNGSELQNPLVFHWLPSSLSEQEENDLSKAAESLNLLVHNNSVLLPAP